MALIENENGAIILSRVESGDRLDSFHSFIVLSVIFRIE